MLDIKDLEPADRLILPKSKWRIVQHHAIFVGWDKNGSRLFVENDINKGVQIITESYLHREGLPIVRIERFKGNMQQRSTAVKKALAMLGTPYDLFNFNCEHYANFIQHNQKFSSQVSNGIGLALIAVLLGVCLSK